MNREEKLEFIEKNHPALYELLKSHVPAFINNVWEADSGDIALYNAWSAFYCGQLKDVDLMNKLLI